MSMDSVPLQSLLLIRSTVISTPTTTQMNTMLLFQLLGLFGVSIGLELTQI